jgi:hypothetical protein
MMIYLSFFFPFPSNILILHLMGPDPHSKCRSGPAPDTVRGGSGYETLDFGKRKLQLPGWGGDSKFFQIYL